MRTESTGHPDEVPDDADPRQVVESDEDDDVGHRGPEERVHGIVGDGEAVDGPRASALTVAELGRAAAVAARRNSLSGASPRL